MEQQVKDDIQRVFQLQKKQQKALRASTAEQRREKLQRFLDSVIAHEEEIIEAIRKDVRKPYHEVKKAEIEGTKKAIRDNMNNLEQWMAPKEVGSSLSLTQTEFLCTSLKASHSSSARGTIRLC